MIAGELESTFDDSYDYFQFGKKNKQSTAGGSKPKVNLGQKLQKVGAKIEKAGGIEGIGKTVDNVRSFFRKTNPAAPPSDYEFGLKKTEETVITEQEEKNKDKKKKNLVMIGVLVTGGILVLGGLVWWMSNQKTPAPGNATISQ